MNSRHQVALGGRTAVVTGAGSGIGRAIAAKLGRAGAQVHVADVDGQRADTVVSEITAAGGHAWAHVIDVTDPDAVEALADGLFQPGGGVDLLFNNAGVGHAGEVADTPLEDWRRIVEVNVMGVIHGVHSFVPRLLAQGRPAHIVNTASMAGLVAPTGIGSYAVAKYGVVALTEVLAAELFEEGSKVGASVLCPGTVHTNIKNSSRNRPAELPDAGLKDIDIELDDNPRHRWIDPVQAGAVVVGAIKRGDLYALTHPDWYPMVAARHASIAAAFAAQAEAAGLDFRD